MTPLPWMDVVHAEKGSDSMKEAVVNLVEPIPGLNWGLEEGFQWL